MNLWERAQNVLPGGVNSPVRAFGSVGGTPVFMERASGSKLWDRDGKEYLDYICSWGPAILGHAQPEVMAAVQKQMAMGMAFGTATEGEVIFAEYLCQRIPGIEMVRLVSSGTEATMAAVRVARGYTQRSGLVKFRGCYHGHGDPFLIQAGSGALTHGVPSSSGVPAETVAQTLLADFNDLDSVRACFEASPAGIAAIILEPVVGNMGVLIPELPFLQGLRELCDQYGALLIFDEVMTGFRLSPTGARGLFDVQPDLFTFGKIIGGGLPVGAYGGSRTIMSQVSPLGPVYQAGTLSGHPWAVVAGLSTLKQLEDPAIYEALDNYGAQLEAGLRALCQEFAIPFEINRLGSMLTLFFADGPIRTYADALRSDTKAYAQFFNGMLERGIYLPPSQYEAWFWSTAHSSADLQKTLAAAREVFASWKA